MFYKINTAVLDRIAVVFLVLKKSLNSKYLVFGKFRVKGGGFL